MDFRLISGITKHALFVDEEAWKAFNRGRTPQEAEAFRNKAMGSESIRSKFFR